MNAIDALFQRLRADGRKAFMPFVTAGDPDVSATVRFARALAESGASLIEIGLPYSDPIADGPVVQASYTRALDRGLKLDAIFGCARQIAAELSPSTPLVAMGSFSLIQRRGAEAFLDQAQRAGFSGAIVPDLPFEESADLARLASQRDFKLIQLVTPTTPRDRAQKIAAVSTGFLYCVSVTGITGARTALPQGILEQLAWLRTVTDLPLCVGFGVSQPEHVRLLRPHADGVIVGSALVRLLEQIGPRSVDEVAADLGKLARSLSEALRPDRRQ